MTVTSVIAHMREAAEGSREIGTSLSREVAGLLTSFADRLQSAHDAETKELRECVAKLQSRALGYYDQLQDTESRLREAERDARRWRKLLDVASKPYPMSEGQVLVVVRNAAFGGPVEIDPAKITAAIDRAMEGGDG